MTSKVVEAKPKKKSGKVHPKYRGDRENLVFHNGIVVGAYQDETEAERVRHYRATIFGEGATVVKMKDAQRA